MRGYGYVRVSTQEQAKEGYSIGAQKERLVAYCKSRDWVLIDTFVDPGYSGAKTDRPALQKLILEVERGTVDFVLVYKLDRLSRSQKDTLYLIEDVFLKNGTAFVSINENFDTSTAFGRAMIGILSVFAQLEREQIRERTEMGLVERAKDGLWHGGGNVAIGYDYIPGTDKLEINEYEAIQVREVFDLFVNQRKSFHAILKHMTEKGYTHKYGAWEHSSTVRNVLTNNLYIGKIKWAGEVYEGKHQPIIDKTLFDAAQLRIPTSPHRSAKHYEPGQSPFAASSLLSGIIYCGECGGRYFSAGGYRGPKNLPTSQKRYIHTYICYSRAKTKKSMIKDPNCKNAIWKAEELDQYVINEIRKLAIDDNYITEITAPTTDENSQKKAVLQQRIEIIRGQINKLIDLYQYSSGNIEQVSQRLNALADEENSLTQTLKDMEREKQPRLTIEQARLLAADANDVFSNGTLEQQRALVQSLIGRITINQRTVTITWAFA